MFYQIHLINMMLVLQRLSYLMDEYCTHVDSVRVRPETVLQRYLRYLLLHEMYDNPRIRDVFIRFMSRDKHNMLIPENVSLASSIEDELHDEILMHIRPYLSMGNDESVVDLQVMETGDVHLVVEERETIRRVTDQVNDVDYGQYDVEDHAFQKMYY